MKNDFKHCDANIIPPCKESDNLVRAKIDAEKDAKKMIEEASIGTGKFSIHKEKKYYIPDSSIGNEILTK